MSYEHINHVRDHSKARGTARHLLVDIPTRTDKQGYAWPSYECLARDMRTDVRSVRRALKAIPSDELEIIPGGSEKGQKRRSTQYRILLNGNDPNSGSTVRLMRTVKEPDRAPNAHGSNSQDRAHTGTGPCANEASTVRITSADRAPNAHLTDLNREEEQKANARARARETSGPNGSGTNTVSENPKPSLDLSEEAIEELIRKHRRLDVRNLIPEAAEKCALKYPEGGTMKRPFFEEYLDRCELDIGPPGLIEGQRIKAEILAEAGLDRNQKQQAPPTEEQKRERFIAALHTRFPEINVRSIADRYLAELQGKPWDNEKFKRRVGEAQEEFWKESRTANATA